MPTKGKKTKGKKPSAADILDEHRADLIRKWMNMFPRARWTRGEARMGSVAVVDSISGFLRTGKLSYLKQMATLQLLRAGTKGTPLKSGLAFLSSAIGDVIDMLTGSTDLDRKNLKAGLSKTIRAFEYLNAMAAKSQLRQTSAADELLRRISFHEGILQNPSVTIFAADSKGKIVLWSKGAEKMSGINRRAVVGKKLPGTLAPGESDSAHISQENLSKAFSQLARRCGTRQRKKQFAATGSVSKITDDAGHFLGITGVAFDLTELRRAEHSAGESQKLLQTILDSIDDLVAVTGGERRLIFTNKAIERLLGFSTSDFLQSGRPPYYMMPDKEKERIDTQWKRVLSSSGPHTIELAIPTKEGKERMVEWKTIRIEDKKGKKFKVVSVGRDMTERIKAQKESELLLDLSSSLGGTLELTKTLAEALEKIMDVFGADAGLIARLEKSTGRLYMLAQKGVEHGIVSRLERRKASDGWTGVAIKTKRPLIIEDIRKSPYKAKAYAEAVRGGYRCFISLPLVFENEVFGVFEIASTREDQFSKSDLNLCASIANILSSAVHNAILHNELAERQSELTELSKKLSSAEEDERRRISADLHDEAAQLLVATKTNMALIARQLQTSNPTARQTLKETAELVSHALDRVRDISGGLHPALLDDIGLAGAVRWLARNTRRTSGVQVRVNSSGLQERLPAPVEASLFRIVQETLNNIARHSKADKAVVNLSKCDSQVRITITDNGVGFSVEKERKSPTGLGLRTLKQRVRWLGGELRVESGHEKGTLVEIQIPMEGYENEKD